jgi:hypothetical protein
MSSEHTESSSTDRNTSGASAAAPSSAGAAHQNAGPHWERQMLSELVTSNLNEQRTARRWKVGLRLGWLFFWSVGWLVGQLDGWFVACLGWLVLLLGWLTR